MVIQKGRLKLTARDPHTKAPMPMKADWPRLIRPAKPVVICSPTTAIQIMAAMLIMARNRTLRMAGSSMSSSRNRTKLIHWVRVWI